MSQIGPSKRRAEYLKARKLEPYQLRASDLDAITEHYKKKFGVTIIINGQTDIGRKIIAEKQAAIQERYEVMHTPEKDLVEYFERRWKYSFLENMHDLTTNQLLKKILKQEDWLNSEGKFRELSSEERSFVNNAIEMFLKKKKYDKKNTEFDIYLREMEFAKKRQRTAKTDEENQNEKENVSLYPYECKTEIETIQKQLGEKEAIGYIFTNGVAKNQEHFEVVIITKNKLIKPVSWVVDNYKEVSTTLYPELTSTQVQQLQSIPFLVSGFDFYHPVDNPKGRISPQAGGKDPLAAGKECGTLGILYLKELLKNNAEQLNKLSLDLPIYCIETEKFNFFLPSPQVLRYSQSGLYNQVIFNMLLRPEPEVKFNYKNKVYTIRSLEGLLKNSLEIAEKLGDKVTVERNKELLAKLPAFRKAWVDVFKKTSDKRETMDLDKLNRYLAYKTRRMEKKAQQKAQITKMKEEKSTFSQFKQYRPLPKTPHEVHLLEQQKKYRHEPRIAGERSLPMTPDEIQQMKSKPPPHKLK